MEILFSINDISRWCLQIISTKDNCNCAVELNTVQLAISFFWQYFLGSPGIFGLSLAYLVHISDITLANLRKILGKSQIYLRHISVTFPAHFRHNSGISQTGCISAYFSRISQAYVTHISDKSKAYLKQISDISKAYLRNITYISHIYLWHI